MAEKIRGGGRKSRYSKSQKILVLCSGNATRSQMAEGFLKFFDPELEVYSAGTHPSEKIHPGVIRVMKEVGIDISSQEPKPIDSFLNRSFDYVINVCDSGKAACPLFIGKVGRHIQMGFPDPAEANGSEEAILNSFRKVRNAIERDFHKFYQKI